MPSVWVRQLDIALQSSELSIIPSAAAASFFFPLWGLKYISEEEIKSCWIPWVSRTIFQLFWLIKWEKCFELSFSVSCSKERESCAFQHTKSMLFTYIYNFFFETKQKLLCVKNKIVRLQKAQSFHFCWSLHASLRSLQSRELGSTHVGGGGWKWEGVCSMLEESRGA